VGTASQRFPDVKTYFPEVGSRLAPDSHEHIATFPLEKFDVINMPRAQLPFDGRTEGWTLKYLTLKLFEDFLQTRAGNIAMEVHHAYVLLSRRQENLNYFRRVLECDGKHSAYPGIERPPVTCPAQAEHPFYPGYYLVRGGTGRFVEVDETQPEMFLDGTFRGLASVRRIRHVMRPDEGFSFYIRR